MDISEIGKGLVALCRLGRFQEAVETYYGEGVVSVESNGETAEGIEAVRGKGQWWADNFETHSVVVEGPFVSRSGFAVRFELDATEKATGNRAKMTETAVYDVVDGKIVREEFYYYVG